MDGLLALGSDPRIRSKVVILWHYYLGVDLVLLPLESHGQNLLSKAAVRCVVPEGRIVRRVRPTKEQTRNPHTRTPLIFTGSFSL